MPGLIIVNLQKTEYQLNRDVMKKLVLACLVVTTCLLSFPVFSQDSKGSKELNAKDSAISLGMAGDGLDLYAVLELFQKSKTIESFEKSLNDPKTKVNNIDLDLDKKIDFIKVVTEKKDSNSYSFVLRVDVSKTEAQDVAVILLDRNKDKKISLQIVGDEELYGKDYVIEPKGNSPITPNPGYTGSDPVTVTVEAQPTTVVVQQAPIVQYVYSPAYAPYYPPYAYGYYPGWFAFTAVVSFGFYAAAWGGHHHGYYGGHYGGGNTVVINNNNNFNNYNNNKMKSDRVSDNRQRGDYGDGRGDRGKDNDRGRDNGRGRDNASNRPSAGTSDRNRDNNNRGRDNSSSRPTTSDRSSPGGGARSSSSTRPTTSDRSSSGFGGSNRSSGSSGFGGGGRSMGGGGGGMRGGGGGRRR
jgi:hypothetical protein